MKSILICWLGFADLKASAGNNEFGLGPIGQAAIAMNFDEIVLIGDHPKSENTRYLRWLKSKAASKVFLYTVSLSGPTNFGEIYESAVNVVDDIEKKNDKDISLTFHVIVQPLFQRKPFFLKKKLAFQITMCYFPAYGFGSKISR